MHQTTDQNLATLSWQEKVRLGTGRSFWSTNAAESMGIRSLTLTDGPHGIRDQGQSGDHLGILASAAATCFPTASALASSWDLDLLTRVGEAIGLEATEHGVDVVLGPGVNMKRNPLCGRNFEYFSEDPVLAGLLAAAWIRGVQSTGTGTSLKHFALNNQELKRMTTDVRVDDRALHEYYLRAFEIAVVEANPTTVMSAYNHVEGVYCSENHRLLTDILRERWGYQGVVVTDWGAMNDRPAAYEAGLDLEMPGNSGASSASVLAALADGRLEGAVVDASVERLHELSSRTATRATAVSERMHDEHHELAHRAASESAVLLKNQGLLPLAPARGVTLIGTLADVPRFQGTGSSRVNPTQVISLHEALASQTQTAYAAGYRIADEPDPALVAEAVELAAGGERVVVCVGLTEDFESEGFDREHMRLPANQLTLLQALAPFADRVAIVLVGGAPVEMPWESSAAAILHMQLAGQGGGGAAADLLLGTANPSGKLTETYPHRYEDVVSAGRFGIEAEQTPYLESMYCGYRHFDSADLPVRYPFGHGLSYTTFGYSDLQVRCANDQVEVTLTVTNTGERAGAEVAQIYVASRTGGRYRPEQELRAFAKVDLEPGECATVQRTLTQRDLAVYDPARGTWVVESGEYEIRVGASSRDIRLRDRVRLAGEAPRNDGASRWYHRPSGRPTLDDFATIHPPFPRIDPPRRGTFDLNSSILEMKDSSLACRIMHRAVERTVAKDFGGRIDYSNVRFKMVMFSAAGLPMRAMVRMSDGAMSPHLAYFFVESANGHTLRGLWGLLRRRSGPVERR